MQFLKQGFPMRSAVLRLAVTLLLMGPTAALPHHSVANFDFSKSSTVTGTVQYFSFTNPHSFIDLQVQDASGVQRAYKIFTVARVVMTRTGWTVGDLKAGDKVTVTGSPDRKDPTYMYLNKIQFASGNVWDHDPALQR
jgi:hypothetical protein